MLSPGRALLLPAAFAAALMAMAYVTSGSHQTLFRSIAAAGLVAGGWTVALWITARQAGRSLTLTWMPKPQHWVQAIAQVMIYIWWARYVPTINAFIPFLVPQIVFAYAVDALLNWTRRDTYAFGFGPIPVILSLNLFLLFRPDWFYWQFAMILVGFLGKELIRWTKDGRSAHIFNPSSFPLAIASVILIATQSGDLTFGDFIANTIHDPPHIYLILLLAALPGQFLFGVARMTLSSVVTMMIISLTYYRVTGTYLFLDSHIPVPVFLGMHLLFTDPSTSPRTELGRLLFGAMYAVFTAVLYVLLPLVGAPTFYDKLLPVPLMNLMVRRLDALPATRWGAVLDPSRLGRALSPARRDLVFALAWSAVFAGLYAANAIGDRHPGSYLPFWQEACAEGSERACRYQAFLTLTYCKNGSGWACNEVGIQERRAGRPSEASFRKACELGFAPGCANAEAGPADPATLARSRPDVRDLPIVLRGTKPALAERDPAVLLREACRQGWPDTCGGELPGD